MEDCHDTKSYEVGLADASECLFVIGGTKCNSNSAFIIFIHEIRLQALLAHS